MGCYIIENKQKGGNFALIFWLDIAAGVLIAIGTYNFATTAKFPLSQLQRHRVDFFLITCGGLPIGTVALVLNIPVAIACYKTLGKGFMLRSIPQHS